MNTPLVTILIPIYNREDYLRECLDSACGQTYRHIEIICVDDGSTDGSSDILAEYAARDNRIVVITQENQGVSGARNSGLAVAKGDWICGLDDDDYLETDALEKLVPLLDDDIDCLCFDRNVLWENPEDEKSLYRMPFDGKYAMTPELFPRINITFWCKLWRRSFIERLGVRFVPGMWYEDNHFSLCTLPWARYVYFSPLRLLNIRRNGTSSIMKETRSRTSRRVLDYLVVYEEIFKHYQRSDFRLRWGVTGVSDMEMNMALRTFNFINANAPLSTLEEGWRESRRLMETYGLLERLPEFPLLAVYYHLPPYVVTALQKMVQDKTMTEVSKKLKWLESFLVKKMNDSAESYQKKTAEQSVAQEAFAEENRRVRQSNAELQSQVSELLHQQERMRSLHEAVVKRLDSVERTATLSALLPSMMRRYWWLRVKKTFSCGARRLRYKRRISAIRALIRECRELRKCSSSSYLSCRLE